MKMFEDMADAIFQEANVPKEGNDALWGNAVDILSSKMAMLSATMGLSMERVTIFEEQKRALVQDLLDMKAAGTLK